MKVICFLIHGIGPQQSEFAKKHTRSVDSYLTKLIADGKKTAPDTLKGIAQPSDVVEYVSLFWASATEAEQERLYRKLYPEESRKEDGIRGLSIGLIGDVFSYLGKSQEDIKRIVFTGFIEKLKKKIDGNEPFSIVIVGHSLGSVILHDMISGLLKFPYANLGNLLPATSVFTLGSPLSLFSLVADTIDPNKFQSWVNFHHSKDPISFPISQVSTSVIDHELRGWFLNPLKAHSQYWEHATVCSSVATKIFEHFTAAISVQPAQLRLPKEIPTEVIRPHHGPALTAGFSDYHIDFGKIQFGDLIDGATEIDICTVYAGSWYKQNAHYLINAFKRPKVEVRVCMLATTSPAIPGFCHQFSKITEEKLKDNIIESVRVIRTAFQGAKADGEPGGSLRLYLSENIINHSFYRFDDLIYFVPRPISSPKHAATPIPVIVFRKGHKNTDFASWIMKDFNALLQTSGDINLDFDSQTASLVTMLEKPRVS